MSTIGKILVFSCLLFSLITSALIVMVFTSQTHWKVGYQDKDQQLAGELKINASKVADLNKTIEARNEQLKLNDQEKKALDKQLKETTADRDNLKKDLDAATNKEGPYEKLLATITKQNTEIASLQAAVTSKDKLVADQLETITALEKKNKETNEQKVRFEIASVSAQSRNVQLVEQLEKVLKELKDVRDDKALKAGTQVVNPPPEDVKGAIKSTDASGLVTINLGSDNGLTKGNTLYVYRLSPKPAYLGVLRVMDVRPHEAVGKLTSAARQLQIGDEVASKILDNH